MSSAGHTHVITVTFIQGMESGLVPGTASRTASQLDIYHIVTKQLFRKEGIVQICWLFVLLYGANRES